MTDDDWVGLMRRKGMPAAALLFLFVFGVSAWNSWACGLVTIALSVYLLRPWTDAESRRG